jgi:hypothetical protein
VLKVVSEIYIYLEVYSISNVLKVVSEIYIYLEVYSIEEFEDTKESVYLRRTDNTMAKGKRTKGQTTINKTYI